MSKKIFIATGLSLLLASSIFAANTGDMKQNFSCKQHMQKEHHMHRGDILSDLKRLNLSEEQRMQVRTIMKDQMKNMPHPNDAFTDNSFDKAMYIKLEQQKRDNMIQMRADMIEKIYNVLNDTQKKELKVMLDKHKNHWMEKK